MATYQVKYPDAIIDQNGNALEGVTVTLFAPGTTTPALYTFTTDSNGDWDWSTVIPGEYDAQISGSGVTTTNYTMFIMRNDAVTQNITAVGDTITNVGNTIILVPDATYALSSTPTIPAGRDGQILNLHVYDSTESYTLTLQDKANLAGSTLDLGGTNIGMKNGDVLPLQYSADSGFWSKVI